MSDDGYIYVKDWKRFQHYKGRKPSWVKLYVDLLGNEEWLRLSSPDVKLLLVIWMLTAERGYGRVSANLGSLKGQARVRKGSLDSLVQAGFIEIRASKALADPAIEVEIEKEHPLTPASGGNGSAPKQTRAERQEQERIQKRLNAVITCRRNWQHAKEDGEYLPGVRESLEREYRHDPSIVTEAIGAP